MTARVSSSIRAGVAPLVVIGLGANLGDRRKAIDDAIDAIARLPGTTVVARSSLWRTTPVGGPPQPDFYNAALAVRSFSRPEDLMRDLLEIEARFGRVRTERNAPRILDLDLLWTEQGEVHVHRAGAPDVDLPHPRLHERAFALAPLLEVVPEAADPATGKRYSALLMELGMTGVAPLDSSQS